MKKYCLCKQYLQWSNIRIYDNTDIDDNVAFNLRLLEILSLKKVSFSEFFLTYYLRYIKTYTQNNFPSRH